MAVKRIACILLLLLVGCSRKHEKTAQTNAVPSVQSSKLQKYPEIMVIYSDNQTPTEQRISLSDDLDIRYGPSVEYPRVSGAQVLKGAPVFVLEESRGWIRIRAAKESGPTVGWINKFGSAPIEMSNPSVLQADLDTLLAQGLLKQIDANGSSATVDTNIWDHQDLAIQKGIGRALAFYCAAQRNSASKWVEIRDANTGSRVAKYSESMGFTSYRIKPEKK